MWHGARFAATGQARSQPSDNGAGSFSSDFGGHFQGLKIGFLNGCLGETSI